jgi:hypothetical protein
MKGLSLKGKGPSKVGALKAFKGGLSFLKEMVRPVPTEHVID